MLDLRALGQELRKRRRSLRIPSTELARRIGVSQTYVWLIEQAKPRPSGEPSRPSEEVLDRWTAALGIGEDEAQRMRQLAGYFEPGPPTDRTPRGSSQRTFSPTISAVHHQESDSNDLPSPPARREGQTLPRGDAPLDALHHWAGIEREDDREQALVQRVREILARVEPGERREEVLRLLDSFLTWLDFHATQDI